MTQTSTNAEGDGLRSTSNWRTDERAWIRAMLTVGEGLTLLRIR